MNYDKPTPDDLLKLTSNPVVSESHIHVRKDKVIIVISDSNNVNCTKIDPICF